MERDLLTEEDLNELVQTYVLVDGVRTPMGCTPVITPQALQRAARLGAERERERCIEAAEGAFPVSVTAGSPYARGYDDGVYAALGAIRKCAAAIRRGEGE